MLVNKKSSINQDVLVLYANLLLLWLLPAILQKNICCSLRCLDHLRDRKTLTISAEQQAKFTPAHGGHNFHEQWSIFPSSIPRLQLVDYVIVAILYSHQFLEDGTKTLIAINHSRPTFQGW